MALNGSISPTLSITRNVYEADALQAAAQKLAVDAEVLHRSTPALIAEAAALAIRVSNVASEAIILDV